MEHFDFDIDINAFNIFNEMKDWVRAVDSNGNVLYVNNKMRADLAEKASGRICYNLYKGNAKYGSSVANYAINTNNTCEIETEIDGKTYEVTTFPVIDKEGKSNSAVQIFRDITYSKQLTEQLNKKNKSMTEDLKFARNMQIRMLPPKEIYNGLKLDFIYEPSEILSGDMFDIFNVDDNRTGFYICDVVGHGVTASLLTMFVRQSVRTLARNETNIEKIMKELHKMFLSLNLDADKYFSIFLGVYNHESKELCYVNAGHNTRPVLCSNKKIDILEKRGYPICNLFDDVDYDASTLKLNVGQILLLYTDGIIEAKNNKLEEFGENRLIDVIKNSDNILHDINRAVKEFSSSSLKDDCALMLIEVVD